MNLETKITIYNFTPSGFYVDPGFSTDNEKTQLTTNIL